eukprot:15339081-Ditylum_brightwellii.AAC.1
MSKATKLEESKETKTDGEPKYLALLTKQLQMLTTKLFKANQGKDNDNVIKNRQGRVVPNWRFKNTKGKMMMTRNITVFNWCVTMHITPATAKPSSRRK